MSGSPYPRDPYRPGSAWSRSFLPLVLITLGVVFLLGNLVPERGRAGLFMLGLGAAFLIGRVTTGRYGYCELAGLLIALGAFVGLQGMQGSAGHPRRRPVLHPARDTGFALVYLIGLRPGTIWPLFPATILVALGVVLYGAAWLPVLASFNWIVAYWPLALVLVGGWLLVQESLPAPLRRPIGTLGGLALLAYGLLAAAASVATGGTLAQTGLTSPASARRPFADTVVTLDAPISSGQTFTVSNPNGRTTRSTSPALVQRVHVSAVKHFSIGGQSPAVSLTPDASGVVLDAHPARQWRLSICWRLDVRGLHHRSPGVGRTSKPSPAVREIDIDGVSGGGPG